MHKSNTPIFLGFKSKIDICPSNGKFKLDLSHPITHKRMHSKKELDVKLPNLHWHKIGTNLIQTIALCSQFTKHWFFDDNIKTKQQ